MNRSDGVCFACVWRKISAQSLPVHLRQIITFTMLVLGLAFGLGPTSTDAEARWTADQTVLACGVVQKLRLVGASQTVRSPAWQSMAAGRLSLLVELVGPHSPRSPPVA